MTPLAVVVTAGALLALAVSAALILRTKGATEVDHIITTTRDDGGPRG